MLPGHKLEWPNFTAAPPVPGHERVKLTAETTLETRKLVYISLDGRTNEIFSFFIVTQFASYLSKSCELDNRNDVLVILCVVSLSFSDTAIAIVK